MKSDVEYVWKTIGHDYIKAGLESFFGTVSTPHAFLFAGPEGVGKSVLAKEFSARLLQTDNVSSHPDFKIFKVTEEIGAEQTRSVISELAGRPFLGKYKIIIIEDADKLNLQSANSLLKTLEEPSPSTILILISSRRNLLPTVVSRCQLVNFDKLTPSDLRLVAQKLGVEVYDDLIKQSDGRASLLINTQLNADSAIDLKLQIDQLFEAYNGNTSSKILAINKFAELEQEVLANIFSGLINKTRVMLSTDTKLVKLLSGCVVAISGLQANLNKKLVLQKLLMH